MPLCLAFGTGEGLLWYGICVPCSKRLPGVRDASSEALGAQKQASTVRKRYSVHKTGFCGTRRIFKGPQNSRLHRLWTDHCRTGRIFSALNGPRSEVSRHKKETKVKDFDLFCRGTVTRTQDPLVPNQMR